MAEADWRLSFRPAILTGLKQRRTLEECRSKANDASKLAVEARREAISIMLEEAKLTKGALEQYIKKRLNNELEISVSIRTIRRDIEAIRET
jgi:predicted RNase H-like HicB family nuclease